MKRKISKTLSNIFQYSIWIILFISYIVLTLMLVLGLKYEYSKTKQDESQNIGVMQVVSSGYIDGCKYTVIVDTDTARRYILVQGKKEIEISPLESPVETG